MISRTAITSQLADLVDGLQEQLTSQGWRAWSAATLVDWADDPTLDGAPPNEGWLLAHGWPPAPVTVDPSDEVMTSTVEEYQTTGISLPLYLAVVPDLGADEVIDEEYLVETLASLPLSPVVSRELAYLAIRGRIEGAQWLRADVSCVGTFGQHAVTSIAAVASDEGVLVLVGAPADMAARLFDIPSTGGDTLDVESFSVYL